MWPWSVVMGKILIFKKNLKIFIFSCFGLKVEDASD